MVCLHHYIFSDVPNHCLVSTTAVRRVSLIHKECFLNTVRPRHLSVVVVNKNSI